VVAAVAPVVPSNKHDTEVTTLFTIRRFLLLRWAYGLPLHSTRWCSSSVPTVSASGGSLHVKTNGESSFQVLQKVTRSLQRRVHEGNLRLHVLRRFEATTTRVRQWRCAHLAAGGRLHISNGQFIDLSTYFGGL
jgi:hypothetical protein